jgi:mRNA interferase RelE/StbE
MYQIVFKETARKELYKLNHKTIKFIATAIDQLAHNPRPIGVKKLKGKGENLLRIRVGDY